MEQSQKETGLGWYTMVSVGNHLESVRAFKAHVPSKHMSSSGSLESANDVKQRRIDELEERVNALVARMVCPYDNENTQKILNNITRTGSMTQPPTAAPAVPARMMWVVAVFAPVGRIRPAAAVAVASLRGL